MTQTSEQRDEGRIQEAAAEAERFLNKFRAYARTTTPHSIYASPERAALRRSALDCGRAMAQVNKSPYKE